MKANIVVIDSILPNKDAVGPRNSDFLEFIKKIPEFKYYTMYTMTPGKKAWFSHAYGMTKEEYSRNLKEYIKAYPQARGKIELLSEKKSYNFNLAYTYFLAETYTLLPFLEKNEVPFVFLLNPGGAFGFDNESSDEMLREIFSSKLFRRVIVNQKLIKEYLLKKKLCDETNIIYDFSGSVQFRQSDVKPKKYFKKDKTTFDICFVAAKYTPGGVDKGYDLFINAAKQLARQHIDMRFHVVGGFDDKDINVTDIKNVIKFYGYLPSAELPNFYASMDIFISPNRPFKLYKGSSDGFPLSAGAMYCGVCGLNADNLHMNTEFKKDEVVIIKTSVKDIVEKVSHLYSNTEKLYSISKKGQKRAQLFYDIEKHVTSRARLFMDLTKGKI